MHSETGKNLVLQALKSTLLKMGLDLSEPTVMEPESSFGDYATNVALVLGKKNKQNPKVLAEQIAEKVKSENPELFSAVSEKAGFVNFRLSEKFLFKNLENILEQRDLYGASIKGGGEKVLVEYFQPNVAKPLHLGHLRTAIIGDAIFKLLASQGYRVESDTHLGDWGTQFGLLLLAYKKYGDAKTVASDPIVELNKLYVRINAEIEKNPDLREEGKAEFVKLEKGDETNRELWKKFKDWSWQEYDVVYKELGVRKSDHDWPESFYEDKMAEVLQALEEKGLLQVSQGAKIVDLEEYGLGVALLVKSDGGTTYLLRDLATYIFRKAQGFERQLYVVDVRQSHTLKQTFKIVELLGHIVYPEEAVHVAYGFLTLPEGAMSTRKGTVVGAEMFIKSVQEEALEVIRQKNPDLESKDRVAKSVAAAAIKYFDLSHNLKSDIVFDPQKALAFEGNSGPYLQYTHARIQGILRKADSLPVSDFDPNSSLNGFETDILRKLVKFPETLAQAVQDLQPNLLCNFLFELSQVFNTFYQEVPILKESETVKKGFRLSLVIATAQVLKNGLYLLGIEAPEEM